jgi:hypothetical protein
MALAETAQLVADLQLKDHLTANATKAKQSLGGLDQAVTQTTGRVGVLGAASARMSGSLDHFRGKVGDLTKKVGILGFGGAVLATTAFLKSSYGEAMKFGDAVDRIATLTGMATQQTSKFVDALGYYGIGADKAQAITGMYLKNIDALTASKKNAAKFESEYGFKLRDSTGHVKDAEEVITSFTEFFNNKAIPASQRAAAGAKLFGRSWQELLPIFQSGGKEWRKQLEAGFELTKEDIRQMKAARAATRDWEDALGDFKVMVGVKLMPTMAELARNAAKFLNDPSNQKTLLGFLDQGIKFGKDLASFLGNRVVPAVRDLATGAQAFWSALPGPLQDLLVTGIAADRTIKYLFGFSITGVAGDIVGAAVKDGLGGILGKLGLTRGSSPANPIYVSGGIGGGGGGAAGGAGGVAAGGGLASKLGRAVSILGAVTIAGTSVAALAEQFGIFQAGVARDQAALQEKADRAGAHSADQVLTELQGFNKHLEGLGILERAAEDTVGGKQIIDALVNQSDKIANGTLATEKIPAAIDALKHAQANAIARGNKAAADHIGADIAKLQKTTTTEGNQQQRAVDRLRTNIKSPLERSADSLATIKNQPTKISVTVPVSTSVSVRDVETTTRTSSRYGFQAS